MPKERSFCTRLNKKRLEVYQHLLQEFKENCNCLKLPEKHFDNHSFETLIKRDEYQLKEAMYKLNKQLIENCNVYMNTCSDDVDLVNGKFFCVNLIFDNNMCDLMYN